MRVDVSAMNSGGDHPLERSALRGGTLWQTSGRVLGLVCAGLFYVSLASSLAAQNAVSTMALSDIRPGMKGQGRTVFKGSKIERFDFEVLGVQRGTTPGRSVILVKASGGPLHDTGILRGMSGSPCYIDGKLIGAISSGWSFQKEPLGGVTPIGEMLEQLQDIPDTSAFRTPLILPKMDPPKLLKSAIQGKMIPLSQLLGSGSHDLCLPITGTELVSEARAFWNGSPLRFEGSASLASGQPLMAKSAISGESGEAASPIEPGGMAVVSLVQGDMDLSSAGTITYISGKRILLFGHALFNMGNVDLPLWSASVVGHVASLESSFKLAHPVAPIGALRLDRSTGVAGILGAEARMVPLRIGLNLGGKRNLNFRFDIMDNPLMTPNLAATVLAQTLATHLRAAGFQSLSLQGNIKLAGQQPIQLEYMVADANASRLSSYLGAITQAVTLNPFERSTIEGISINVKAEERLDRTQIAGVKVLKSRVRRGDVLPVLVTLQNFQGVRETATFNLNVHSSARPGKATLLVGDGGSLLAADPDEKAVEISSLGDMVRLLNGSLRNNHAYSLLVQAQMGIGLRGARIEDVPPSVSSLLGSDGDNITNRLQRRIIGKAVLPLEREVTGMLSLELEIE